MSYINFFDLHCDTPYKCYKGNEQFYVNQLAVSGKCGEIFENWTQTFAFWINDDIQSPWSLYKKMMDDFREKIAERPKNLTPLFAVEGGALLENDVDRLYDLKTDGIKFLTLTWNGENAIAGGIKSDKGLTTFGRKVINTMNSLNIACDLSHLNDKSFFEVLEQSRFPIATHSNCRALFNHQRNLTDEQIKLLAEKNGIIGLCFYPEFSSRDIFKGIYENIFHLCDKGYENNIAIGSDFDGAEMNDKLCNIGQIPELYGYLSEKGLKKSLLDKIFYENAYNFVANLT